MGISRHDPVTNARKGHIQSVALLSYGRLSPLSLDHFLCERGVGGLLFGRAIDDAALQKRRVLDQLTFGLLPPFDFHLQQLVLPLELCPAGKR